MLGSNRGPRNKGSRNPGVKSIQIDLMLVLDRYLIDMDYGDVNEFDLHEITQTELFLLSVIIHVDIKPILVILQSDALGDDG